MRKNYYIVLISALVILTGALALSVHVFIQYFHSPVFSIDPKFNPIIDFTIEFATIIGAIIIYLLSREYWDHIKIFYRVISFAILLMALTQKLLRTLIMD